MNGGGHPHAQVYLKGTLEKHSPAVYLISRDPALTSILASQLETLATLAKSTKSPPPKIHLVPAGCSAPKGCATEVLGSHCEVHMLLKGVVDFSKEVARLNKEKAQVAGRRDKLIKKREAADYATKCPASTQARTRSPRSPCPARFARPAQPGPPSDDRMLLLELPTERLGALLIDTAGTSLRMPSPTHAPLPPPPAPPPAPRAQSRRRRRTRGRSGQAH